MKKAYENGKNPLIDKSLELAKFIAKKAKYSNNVSDNVKATVLQLTRSSSSVAANCSEAQAFFTDKYKHSKFCIALGECLESRTHIEILYSIEYFTVEEYNYLISLCDELCRILHCVLYKLKVKIKNS